MIPQFNRIDRRISQFLDQMPTLQNVIKEFLSTLDLDRPSMAFGDAEIQEIECRSRDGFIRASHNFGGFDLTYMSDVNSCNGSGCGPNLAAIDRTAEWAYKTAKEQFLEDRADALKGVPADKVNYHDLHELGLSRLAEDLSELESELMSTPVHWGVRAMYEGADKSGIHTLCIHASGNVCDYYGAFGKGSEDLGEWEIRFRTASGLKRQLQRLKSKIEQAF